MSLQIRGFADAQLIYTPSLSLPLFKGESAPGREGARTLLLGK